MNLIKFRYIFIYIFFLYISEIFSKERKLISIPFELRPIDYFPEYNSTNFLYDYLKRNLFLKFIVGTPPKMAYGLFEQADQCFEFKKNELNIIFNNKTYCPNNSSSFTFNNNQKAFDEFYFNENYTKLQIEFSIMNSKKEINSSFTPVIGLSGLSYFSSKNCPNIFTSLKNKGNISKLMVTILYENKNEGHFIIGEKLSEYNELKYPESNIYTLNMRINYFIDFESVYINNTNRINSINSLNNNLKIALNMTTIMINYQSSFIIGVYEYKKIIDEIYFNDLINKNICRIDETNYAYNRKKIVNIEYYVYSCDEKLFTNYNNINYYANFPSLIFSSKIIEYNFEFTNKDLFEHILNRYYFLVIFQKTYMKKDQIWYFGEPFYKKFPFSYDLDDRTISFYLEKDNEFGGSDRNGHLKSDIRRKNQTYKILLLFIIILLLLLFLILIAVYIYLTIKERRKKRINELKDDNYEYLSEKDKVINSPY